LRLNIAVPEAHVQKPVLDAALEAVTRLNETLIADGSAPPIERGLDKGIRWKPEPFDEEHFDHAATVMRRGWGDCDDLAPWLAATLRHNGKDPNAKAIVRRSGPHRWHAIVQRSDGSIDDPSRWAGMGQERSVRGASLALMYPPPSGVSGIYEIKPAMAVRPHRGLWQARVDIPWHQNEGGRFVPSDYAMTALTRHRSAGQAIVGAIEGACKIGIASGTASRDHVNRLCAIADAIEGVDIEHIAACYGDEHALAAQQVVGSLWGKLKKAAKSVANTAAKGISVVAPVAKFIPGVSQAFSAYDLAKGAYGQFKNVREAVRALGVNPAHMDQLVRAGFPVI
jgi:hypothetical protein